MDEEELQNHVLNETESEIKDGNSDSWSYDTQFEFVVHGLLISIVGSNIL